MLGIGPKSNPPQPGAASRRPPTPPAADPLEAARSLPPAADKGRGGVAIVGGGAGGIAAAYCLGSTEFKNIHVFESRPKIGGHCDSEIVEANGKRIAVDLGAQFFHPDTHPLYVTFLEELGLYNPEKPGAGETLKTPGSICIHDDAGGPPRFSSQHPLRSPLLAVDFAIYARHARKAVIENLPWEVTLEEWVGGLPVSKRFTDKVLYPWLTAAIGTGLDNAKRSSARSILQTFALAFPSNMLKGASTYNSKVGLQGNLERMLENSPGTQVFTDSTVRSLEFEKGGWTVRTDSGSHGPYDAVVMNAPPHASKNMLPPQPWADDLRPLLDRFEYFDTRMVIHTDPKYVHPERRNWAAYNVSATGAEGEGSVWYGGIHPKFPDGRTVDVFKSWAERRPADPENILHERTFRHPLITPDSIGAARSLQDFQGRNGLYFSGQAMTGADTQDAAVHAAMRVAKELAPDSARIQALRDRMERQGRAPINYDL